MMSERARNLISRSTLLVSGMALLWAAWSCGKAALRYAEVESEWRQKYVQPGSRQRHGGAWILPAAAGVGLMGLGGSATFFALAPLRLIYRIKPRPPVLHENPQGGSVNRF